MKKTLLAGAMALAFGTLTAQDMSFGLRAGYARTAIQVEDPDGEWKGGFTGGLFGNYAFSDKFSLQVEALYLQAGVIKNSNLEMQLPVGPLVYEYSALGQTTISNDYIAVPVFGRYNIGSGGLQFDLGIQVGFLASSNLEWEGDVTLTGPTGDDATAQLPAINDVLENTMGIRLPESADDMTTIAEEQTFTSTDFSLLVGLGYQMPESPFSVNARLAYGLTDINDKYDTDATLDTDVDWMKNIGLQFTLAYSLGK